MIAAAAQEELRPVRLSRGPRVPHVQHVRRALLRGVRPGPAVAGPRGEHTVRVPGQRARGGPAALPEPLRRRQDEAKGPGQRAPRYRRSR